MIVKLFRQIKNATLYSIDGLKFLLSSEFAARIEVYAYFWSLVLFYVIKAPLTYFLIGTILFLILLAVETLNTAIEVIIDRITPEKSDTGKQAKDLGSFAVMCLLSSCALFIAYVIYVTGLKEVVKSFLTPFGKTLLFFVFLAASLRCLMRAKLNLPIRLGTLGVIAAALIGLGVYFTSSYFTGGGVDDSVMYHLGVGLDGAGFMEYWKLIASNIVYAGLILVFLFFTFDALGQKRHMPAKVASKVIGWKAEENDGSASRKGFMNTLVGLAFLGLSVLFNPITSNVYNLIQTQNFNSPKFEVEHYKTPLNKRIAGKKNIVYIYAESFERSYLDDKRFPGLTPNMKKLESQGLSFTNISTVSGTGYTMGGIVGSQCGIPIYSSTDGNSIGNFDKFLPGALCLGDILKLNNYRTVFMGGASLEFAGKGKFHDTHGFDEIIGKQAHADKLKDRKKIHNWGLYDQFLFDEIYEKFIELNQSSAPFALFGLTLDTHHPRGHISPACKGAKYRDGKNDILNAVKCSDQLIYGLVSKIRKSQYANDTLIVIGSDHLAMKNTASDLLKTGPRKNLFVVIDPQNPSKKRINRKGSILDTGITVLNLMGFRDDALGFGRNLLSSDQNLLDIMPTEYNNYLRAQKSVLIDHLWDTPRLAENVKIDLLNNRLESDERWFGLPVLIALNDTGGIIDIEFDHPNPDFQDDYLISRLPDADRFIWVDDCIIMDVAGANPAADANDSSLTYTDWCISTGQGKGKFKSVARVQNEQIVSKSSLFNTLAINAN